MSAETPAPSEVSTEAPPPDTDCSPGGQDGGAPPTTPFFLDAVLLTCAGMVAAYAYFHADNDPDHEHGLTETITEVAIAVFFLVVLVTKKVSTGLVAVAGLAAVAMPLVLVWHVVAEPALVSDTPSKPPSDVERKRQHIPEEAVFVSAGVTHDIYKMEETPGKWVEFHAIHMYKADGTLDAERIRAYREAVAKPGPKEMSMCSVENSK